MCAKFAFCSLAFIVGALVGLSELLSRYAWTLRSITKSGAGNAYLVINGIVAVVAYLAANEWNIHAGLEGKSEIWRVILVSLVAMALLRSSFANFRFGDKDIEVGLASFLQIFMNKAERSLDQRIALDTWERVTSVVDGLTYAATRDYLLAVSEGALRSLSTQEIDVLRKEAGKIDALEVDDATKMQLLAMRIVEKTSTDLFVSFASSAKVKLAAQNDLAAKQAAEKIQRLAQAKNLLLE